MPGNRSPHCETFRPDRDPALEGAPCPGLCLAWRASSNFAYLVAKCSPPAAQTGNDLTGSGPKISSVVEAQGPLGGRRLGTYLFRRAAARVRRDNCRLLTVLWPYWTGPFRKWPAFRGKAGPLPSIESRRSRSQRMLLPSCATNQSP